MNTPDIPPDLVHSLKTAQRVVVLTGAGVSAESNIPTFRDAQTGLWARFRPEELATPEAFQADPKLVWQWYQWRRQLIAGAKPNPGHRALAVFEKMTPDFLLVTQNVDGLHQQAGSQNVVELHGNIHRVKCFEHNHPVTTWQETDEIPPRRPQCGGRLRPDVVWFGETLPPDALYQATLASAASDVFFSVGTSAVVYPAASLVYEAMRRGSVTVEINPQTTPQSSELTHALKGPAGLILPALVEAVWPGSSTGAID